MQKLTPDRRTLLALFSLAFGLRVLYAVVFSNDPGVIGVRETYEYSVAARMAENFDWIATPFSPVAPGYRTLLSLAFRLFGTSWWTAVLLNASLGALTTLFLYRIGEKRLGRHVGLASALWLGAFVHQIHLAAFPIRDVFVTFLLTWLVYTLVRPFHRMRSALMTAFIYTWLVYTEPMFLVLLPVLLVVLGLRATHHRVLSLQYLFLFIATLFVLNIPWTVRNYIVHKDLIPVSLEATRYTGPVTKLLRVTPADPELPPDAIVVPKPGFLESQREFWRVVRVAESHDGAEPAWSLRHNVTSLLNFGILIPPLLVGAVVAWRRRHRAALVIAGTIVSYAVMRGILPGSEAARLPIEPLVVLLAFYGVGVLLGWRRAAGVDTPVEDAAR